jgi:transposase
MVNKVDEQHKLGITVTRNKLRLFLQDLHGIKPSKSTITRYMRRGGVTYEPHKKKLKNRGTYRPELLRNYLIKLNDLVKGKEDPACDYVLCFTDESYCHQNHVGKKSFCKKDSVINRTTSKGTRIIILQAMTEKEPLTQKDKNGRPIDSVTFKPNNDSIPIVYEHPDELKTAECMWKAGIKTGDYHDNMNSEMFLNWVKDKLIPTFERENPNKRMILILDNAAYHHKREVGNLSSCTKPQLRIIADKYNIQHLDVPLTTNRLHVLENDANVTAHVEGEDYCRIMLNGSVDVFDRASAKNPMIPTSDELKLAILNYLKVHNKEVLECKVEQCLNDRGHEVVWTPPYTPDLQPIELFWAAGKNHVALNSKFGITIKEVIGLLREGWYGKSDEENNKLDEEFRKRAVRCNRLFQHTIKMANDKFVPICSGINGTIGNLWIDPDYVPNYDGLPLDMLIAGLGDPYDPDEDDDRYGAVDVASL